MAESIRPLRDADVPQAKALWETCFGDSGEYIDFFFTHKFASKHSLGLFADNRLVSDLFMLKKTLYLDGEELPVGFLSGCATHPDFQHKGYMRRLLYEQLRIMAEQGYSLCALHPFLHAFYRKFGWETVSYMYRVCMAPETVAEKPLETAPDVEMLLQQYARFMEDKRVYFKRSLGEMRLKVREHCADGGKVLQCIEYYALYDVLEDHIDVVENTCRTQAEQRDMIKYLSGYALPVYFWSPVQLTCTVLQQERCEYTMFRVCDSHMMPQKYSAKEQVSFMFSQYPTDTVIFFDQF